MLHLSTRISAVGVLQTLPLNRNLFQRAVRFKIALNLYGVRARGRSYTRKYHQIKQGDAGLFTRRPASV